jgi:hypothetical protein
VSRFVLRTVKGGQVTIDGRQFAPDEKYMAYDGRLEGLRFAFGVYHYDARMVALWGSEDAYMATRRTASSADQARYACGECDSPEVVDIPGAVGGVLPWYFWREVRRDA